MDKYRSDKEQNEAVDRYLQEMFGFTDEQLLKEFEEAEEEADRLPLPAPPTDEFEKICARLEADSSVFPKKPVGKRPRWKRLLIAAVLIGSITVSGGVVAFGTKSYFFREQSGRENVFNNDTSNRLVIDDENEAYDLVGEKLGIKPLKVMYKPKGMYFVDMSLVKDAYATLRFDYEGNYIYFVQSKYDQKASFQSQTDMEYSKAIENKRISSKIDIYQESLEGGKTRYFMSVLIEGSYYSIWGIMEERNFDRLVSQLMF